MLNSMLNNILGERKLYVCLNYDIKPQKTDLGVIVNFNKKDLKNIAKALKLTNRYLAKMKKLGFKPDKAEVEVKEDM